ncbi:ATP-binding protein [Streptomyces sp. NPDC093097]|uniref:ATP-binding protein n=1 Tax=Streptomyces sp. NPDC093097 TaxID=3366027 RepID=UPI0038240E0B
MSRRPEHPPRAKRTRCRSGLPAWTATLTWKAAVFITATCCALAAQLGLLVHATVTRQIVGRAEDRALSQLTDATTAYQAGGRLKPGAGIDPDGLPEELRRLAVGGSRGTMVSTLDSRPTMWAAGPADGGRALAAHIDYTPSAHTINRLDTAIIDSSALAIGATLLVAAFVMTRVTRRLHHTAAVARQISAGDLDARVHDPRTHNPSRHPDEVTSVAEALDTMASSLQNRLQIEQRFTADVAHELRTPLTGLHTAAQLLPAGRPTQLVQDRVAALCTLTEDLLEISRLDTGAEALDLNAHQLGPLAEHVTRAWPTTRTDIVHDTVVETDRRRLERVLTNLVTNAHKHGHPPVVLTVNGPIITVRDHGKGYPDYLLQHGPHRFRTEAGNKGHGLGLTIALGQTRTLGAELTFQNTTDGGAQATLTLPHGACPING